MKTAFFSASALGRASHAVRPAAPDNHVRAARTGLAAVLAAMVALSGAVAPLAAQAPAVARIAPIETDRPDFIESSVVVPRGFWQLENGLLYARDAGFGSLRGTETLLRVSIADRWEWRLGLPSLFVEHGTGASAAGHSDAYFGIKYQLGPIRDWDIALIPGTSVPLGDPSRTSGAWDPEFKFTWSGDVGAGVNFSGMLDASWPTDAGAHGTAFLPALSLAREVAPHLRLFVEWVGGYARGEASSHLAHAGLAWRVTDHLQLDTHVGRRIAGDLPAGFIAFGASFRRGPRVER